LDDRAGAQRELLLMADRLLRWYESLAEGLEHREQLAEPLEFDKDTGARLVEAVRRDLHDEDGRGTATGVRVVWTGDHLEAARRLQTSLATAARGVDAQPGGGRLAPFAAYLGLSQ
jgi:hypothetical protein